MSEKEKIQDKSAEGDTTGSQPRSQLKDALFRALFKLKKRALELYRALHPNEKVCLADIKPIKLPKVFGNKFRNDVAFTVNDRGVIILCEHQSTVNLNMPLRLLIYYVYYLISIVKRKGFYALTRIMLLRPEFYVFYNGKDGQPEHRTMRLSEAFADGDSSWIELRVECYNINYDMKSELLAKCETLRLYSLFIDMVRKAKPTTNEEMAQAVRHTVEYFIEHNLLKDFMLANKDEVINMFSETWDQAYALDVRLEDGIKLGMAKGMAKGMDDGIKLGMAKGMDDGLDLMSKLTDTMLSEGRIDELKQCLSDPVLRNRYMVEYGIMRAEG